MDDFILFRNVTEKIVSHFSESNIKSILAYGSRITNVEEVDKFSDYDMTVVFNQYPEKEFPSLPQDFDITTVFWCEIEKFGVENFQLDHHGIFYVYMLAESTSIYGKNCFSEILPSIDEKKVINSLKHQIICHCWKLKKIILFERSDKRLRDIVKYFFRISQNIFFLERGIDYRLFKNKNYSEWLSILSQSFCFKTEKINLLRMVYSNFNNVGINDLFSFVDFAFEIACRNEDEKLSICI